MKHAWLAIVVCLLATPAAADQKHKGKKRETPDRPDHISIQAKPQATAKSSSGALAKTGPVTTAQNVKVAPEQTVTQSTGPVTLKSNPTQSVVASPEQTVSLVDESTTTLEIAPGAIQTLSEGDQIEIDASDRSTHEYNEAAATAVAGYGNTTASCFRTYGVGSSRRDGSWSLGWPMKDKNCELGEDAALAFMMGNELAGWRMYCAQSNVQGVYGWKRFRMPPWKKPTVSRADASEKCLTEAGVWAAMVKTDQSIAQAVLRMDRLEETIRAQGETIAALMADSHKPGALTVARVEAIAQETHQEIVYETVAAEQAAEDARPPQPCPLPDQKAAMCDGVLTFNTDYALGAEAQEVYDSASLGLESDESSATCPGGCPSSTE